MTGLRVIPPDPDPLARLDDELNAAQFALLGVAALLRENRYPAPVLLACREKLMDLLGALADAHHALGRQYEATQ